MRGRLVGVVIQVQSIISGHRRKMPDVSPFAFLEFPKLKDTNEGKPVRGLLCRYVGLVGVGGRLLPTVNKEPTRVCREPKHKNTYPSNRECSVQAPSAGRRDLCAEKHR